MLQTTNPVLLLALLPVAAYLLYKAALRLQLSLAKQPGLVGHVKMAKRVSKWIPYYGLADHAFFESDQPNPEVAKQRKQGFLNLAERLRIRDPELITRIHTLKNHLSDSRFTGLYRVPFQFRKLVSEKLTLNPFLSHSSGVNVWDEEGRQYMDVTGSYGCNLLGYDAYKQFLSVANNQAHDLGPVLGHYHPVILDNVTRLCNISGMDEVSFHMSGTEAVMQAVRLAQYHTGRKRIVRFAGAYHGWWGEVQPGIGNPVNAQHTLTLKECSARTLAVLKSRNDIACVLVNPLQALHPNGNAPSDSSLVTGTRRAGYDKAAYTQWLSDLREVCTSRGIVLILDEVFLGFRLGLTGAQGYFGVEADMVTYGKTLGGGLPVGVLCGKARYMARYKPAKPADICFARGTFNAHPYVMLAMNQFLHHVTEHHQMRGVELDALWDGRAQQLNQRLTALGLPVQVRNMVSVWTVVYSIPSRYHWMFQFYLRDAGLLLSWVGSGRLIFSHNFTDSDFTEFENRFVQAAKVMQSDGWWTPGARALSRGQIVRSLVLEMINKTSKGK
ncbi:MAG: aminotransferase class III-fold pyridoxal phosphate-dependent enzyme [Limnobacter sp.]|nr:aminotransferase class III-fold pyridoxal phosphate-dependent enzyme [Limnobacter sp.]